jgi:hypothetical protein
MWLLTQQSLNNKTDINMLIFVSVTYTTTYFYWARGSDATNRKVAGSIPDEVNEFFQFTESFRPHCPGVYSASNRNEYQKHKNNNVSGK